jgi:hypothetical protein
MAAQFTSQDLGDVMRLPFILTGASGWFGRVALWEYERMYGPEALRREVIACSSSRKQVDFGSPYGPIGAIALEELDDAPACSGILHLAFLTRDRIKDLGVQKYIKDNRRISSIVNSVLQANPGIPAITTSSGAAEASKHNKKDIEEDPYGWLKREDEELWKSASRNRSAIVFRVYAASGRFMKDPRIFALGDFISTALAGNQITLTSNRPVMRSYVNVGCLMRLCWLVLARPFEPGLHQVNACSHSTSLLDLAYIVSKIWGVPEPISTINELLTPEIYVADEGPFLKLLEAYGLTSPDLIDQIIETSIDIAPAI